MSKKVNCTISIILCIISIVISGVISYNYYTNTLLLDESAIKDLYNEEIQKRNKLQEIADKVIITGSGIAIEEIDTANIGYRLSDQNENIEFYYYIKEEETVKQDYYARILLSKDYNIIEEEYSHSVEDMRSLTEYTSRKIQISKVIRILFSFVIIGLVVCFELVAWNGILLIMRIYKIYKEK